MRARGAVEQDFAIKPAPKRYENNSGALFLRVLQCQMRACAAVEQEFDIKPAPKRYVNNSGALF